MNTFADAARVLRDAIGARVFPAAAAEIGASEGVLWQEALGTLTFDQTSEAANLYTPFDLASLTKVIGTTTVVMQLVELGALQLDEPVSSFFDEWRGADRDTVNVRDLLEHASGLAARLTDPPGEGRREFEHDICTMQLEYEPRSSSIYSDLGFILLGFIAADRGGRSLEEQVRLKADTPDARHRAAPTIAMNEDRRRGQTLVGEVHDNYAAALGGFAGHAGLFGTAPAVGEFARTVLRAARGDPTMPPPFSPDLVRAFTTKSRVPGSSRALGWDTMLPTSSCGTRMSGSAFGHVGFTGTSLWIDPERDRYFVLLTNRVCGGGTVEDMRRVRRAFHDASPEQP
jgi:CubicO group peptidase (beta-lactamase class C family)